MISVIICEDDRSSVKKYSEMLSEICGKNNIEIKITDFPSAEAMLFKFEDFSCEADIIFLDIIMNKLNGMEAARKLRERGCQAEIIFITSVEDFVFEAFDVNPVQYLLKSSVDINKFEEVFLKAVQLVRQKETEMFYYEFDGIHKALPVRSITHFEIQKRVITVNFLPDKSDEFYGSMNELEKSMKDKDFIRVHRSFLVHIPFIAQFHSHSIVLKNGKTIPVGITYAEALKHAFAEYILKTIDKNQSVSYKFKP